MYYCWLTKEESNELYDEIADKGYDLFYFADFDRVPGSKAHFSTYTDMRHLPHC